MATTFSFTYFETDGSEGRIDLASMRKLWVDRNRSGIVFVDAASDGSETEHEVVIEGLDGASGMAEVMETLLAAQSFERVESPAAHALLLEFRYPRASTVALSYRA